MPWKTFVRQDRRRNVHLRDAAGKPEGVWDAGDRLRLCRLQITDNIIHT